MSSYRFASIALRASRIQPSDSRLPGRISLRLFGADCYPFSRLAIDDDHPVFGADVIDAHAGTHRVGWTLVRCQIELVSMAWTAQEHRLRQSVLADLVAGQHRDDEAI